MFLAQYDVLNRFLGRSRYLAWVRYNAKIMRENFLDGIKVIEVRFFGDTFIRFREPTFGHDEDIHIYLPFFHPKLDVYFKVFLPDFTFEIVGSDIRARYKDEVGFFVLSDKMLLRIVDGVLVIRRNEEMR